MAVEFVVEDGTQRSDATSYLSAADADQALENLGLKDSAWDAATKTVALNNATRYIERKYRGRFVGRRASEDQALEWPRSDAEDHDEYAYDTDEIPQGVKNALALLAKAYVDDGSLESDVTAADSGIVSERIRVGDVETATTHQGRATQKRYLAAERELSHLVISGHRIERA